MGKTFVQGLVIIVAGIVALILNQLLNLGLGSITFGLAVGAILGLVSDGGPVGRIGAFVVGIVVAMVLFVLSVLLLNTSFAGQVITILIGIGLITIICGLTAGRLPLWAGLLGAVLVGGAYGQAFAANPAGILTELPQYTTQALVPAVLGLLATIFVADKVTANTGETNADSAAATAGPPPQPATAGAAATPPPPSQPPTTPPVSQPGNPNSEV